MKKNNKISNLNKKLTELNSVVEISLEKRDDFEAAILSEKEENERLNDVNLNLQKQCKEYLNQQKIYSMRIYELENRGVINYILKSLHLK